MIATTKLGFLLQPSINYFLFKDRKSNVKRLDVKTVTLKKTD
jgi:hypothetical protein